MSAKFKVGDLVRCLNPSHPGKNPFVIGEIQTWFVELLYCKKFPPVTLCKIPKGHEGGLVGCRESYLELVKEAHEAH